MAKIRNFDSFGAVFPLFCADKREIWHGRADLPRAKFHVYWGNVSPLRGEKPIFGPLSKNNTGMAAIRAGLPVKMTEFTDIKQDNIRTNFNAI